MAMRIGDLCRFKYNNGYRYVAVNEFTGKLDFLKEDDLADWYKKCYMLYLKDKILSRSTDVRTFPQYKKENVPDPIEKILA